MKKIFLGIPFAGTRNSMFRDKIVIDFQARRIEYFKRSSNILGYQLQSMRLNDIASVILLHRSQYLLFSNIIIESNGGTYCIEAKGFLPSDAKEIKRLLEANNVRRVRR